MGIQITPMAVWSDNVLCFGDQYGRCGLQLNDEVVLDSPIILALPAAAALMAA